MFLLSYFRLTKKKCDTGFLKKGLFIMFSLGIAYLDAVCLIYNCLKVFNFKVILYDL